MKEWFLLVEEIWIWIMIFFCVKRDSRKRTVFERQESERDSIIENLRRQLQKSNERERVLTTEVRSLVRSFSLSLPPHTTHCIIIGNSRAIHKTLTWLFYEIRSCRIWLHINFVSTGRCITGWIVASRDSQQPCCRQTRAFSGARSNANSRHVWTRPALPQKLLWTGPDELLVNFRCEHEPFGGDNLWLEWHRCSRHVCRKVAYLAARHICHCSYERLKLRGEGTPARLRSSCIFSRLCIGTEIYWAWVVYSRRRSLRHGHIWMCSKFCMWFSTYLRFVWSRDYDHVRFRVDFST